MKIKDIKKTRDQVHVFFPKSAVLTVVPSHSPSWQLSWVGLWSLEMNAESRKIAKVNVYQ